MLHTAYLKMTCTAEEVYPILVAVRRAHCPPIGMFTWDYCNRCVLACGFCRPDESVKADPLIMLLFLTSASEFVTDPPVRGTGYEPSEKDILVKG